MAREIHIPYGVVGSADVYLRFRNASGQYRRGDTGAYEAFNAANIALYGADTGSGTPYHVAAEDDSTGDYFADLPDATARGWSAYLQAGAAPSADGGVDVEIASDRIGIDATAAAQVNAEADQAATDYGANKTTPPSASTIAGAVLDEAKGSHAGHLANIPTNPNTIAPDPAGTGAAIVSALSGIPLDATETQAAAAAAIAAAGLAPSSGARTCVLTINDGTDPLESASVRVTKGAESYVLPTDTSGQVTFNLDDGTWTVAITLAGYVFAGDSLVVDGDETATYSMTANGTVPAPSTTAQCTGYSYVYDEDGNAESAVDIVCELTRMPSGSALIGEAAARTETSGAGGLVVFTNIWMGGTYRFYRSGSSKRFAVTIDAADVDSEGRYPLPNFVG